MIFKKWRKLSKKRKKEVKYEIYNCFRNLLLFAGLMVIIYGMMLFYSGFHNVDLVWNVKYTSLKLGEFDYEKVNDTGVDYEVRTIADAYLMGLRQLVYGFYWALFGGLIFGMAYGFEPERYKK